MHHKKKTTEWLKGFQSWVTQTNIWLHKFEDGIEWTGLSLQTEVSPSQGAGFSSGILCIVVYMHGCFISAAFAVLIFSFIAVFPFSLWTLKMFYLHFLFFFVPNYILLKFKIFATFAFVFVFLTLLYLQLSSPIQTRSHLKWVKCLQRVQSSGFDS